MYEESMCIYIYMHAYMYTICSELFHDVKSSVKDCPEAELDIDASLAQLIHLEILGTEFWMVRYKFSRPPGSGGQTCATSFGCDVGTVQTGHAHKMTTEQLDVVV